MNCVLKDAGGYLKKKKKDSSKNPMGFVEHSRQGGLNFNCD